MRPIKLKMSAFGAYIKPIEIDFEKGLGKNKFFLIHGATGSGKTTILDAICFALYGKSSGGSRTGEMMRSEQATAYDKTQVEFIFELRGKKYRIVRNPAYLRPKLRGIGGFTEETASAQIFEDEKPIEAKNVSKYVENLLKFTPEQFRQVIMLPQGAFQKFLLADSKKKQEVLDMLFNAEFFRRVEDELKAKMASAKSKFDILTEQKGNLLGEIENEEELPALIKNLATEIAELESRIKILDFEALEAQKNYNNGEILCKQFSELEIKRKSLESARNLLEKLTLELETAKIELEKRKSEESRRKELEKLISELEKKKSALKTLQDKQSALQTAIKSEEIASEEVKRLEKLKKACDDTMKRLEMEEKTLQDAPIKLKIAEQKLKDAKLREKILLEIEELHKKISDAKKNLATASKNYESEEKNLYELRQAQISGSAARLAANLSEGTPCPVCGAVHHPKIAISAAKIPTDAQINAAEMKLKALGDKKNSATGNLARLNGELATKEKNLSENAQIITVTAAQSEFDKISADVNILERLRTRIANGKVKTQETINNLESANAIYRKNLDEKLKLSGEISIMAQNVEEKYSANPRLIDEELFAANRELNKLNSDFQHSQDNFNRLNAKLAAQNATLTAAEKNFSEIAVQVEGKTLPDIFALKKARDDTQANFKASIGEKAKISARFERINDVNKKISALNAELKLADKNFLMWKTLSDVASGKISKISFQRYYLATMFGEVILEANNRLEKMSGGRYRFQNRKNPVDGRRLAGLDLEIFDEYSGTARPVETLSGGESFLASLSLALGLAAVVQNNSGGIKLDTIFIDEGFGTLDAETLDFALKTLMELQGGRLIGIISHVEELKNQIPVRLEIIKGKTGSTAKFIS